MDETANDNSANDTSFADQLLSGNAGQGQNAEGITTRAFFLNLATGFVLFAVQFTAFHLLKSSSLGRRIYQPKSYLVQARLRVEAIPASPLAWIRRILTIKGEELIAKCGLDGYFAIRFLRAMLVIFVPLMILVVSILIPLNYDNGKFQREWVIGDEEPENYNVTGLDTLSWQNVPPPRTQRYWAHLICALIAIVWTLYRIYKEKLHFVQVRQDYLTSPEHRLKASARTILVTNIPSEYRSEEALKELFDIFIDGDDRSKLVIWVNRDYSSLNALVKKRRKLCQALEKEEVRVLRLIEKRFHEKGTVKTDAESPPQSSSDAGLAPGVDGTPLQRDSSETTANSPRSTRGPTAPHGETQEMEGDAHQLIDDAFEADNNETHQLWRQYLEAAQERKITVNGKGDKVGKLSLQRTDRKSVSKIAWLRAQIARLSVEIDELLPHLDDESKFPLQNSAFIQFERQMAANFAVAMTAHHKPGIMSPRFLHVAPHEIVWKNMGLTSRIRFVRKLAAFAIFTGILFLWAIPAFFFGTLSQLDQLRDKTAWLQFLQDWPSWVISVISGPLVAILLALLIQLVVPALCRKLAILMGAPTRSRRELATQSFYFTFLFIELVLVTSISAGIFATIGAILDNPASIPTTLATNLPKAANYFFNYLIIQALGFSGSLLFQYLRVLFITLIWPWFTQTPRQEAWLQTTIPHQMWANVFSIWTNFAAIGLIYSIIAPLMLVFISVVFSLFWMAYRHNYYYVQRTKVDTHGQIFNQALSQLLAGVYVLEITLIGLFFLVRNENGNVTCTPQAIIMIVALALTAAYHFVLEGTMSPLYDLLPVTLEDKAAERERRRFQANMDAVDTEADEDSGNDGQATPDEKNTRNRMDRQRDRGTEKGIVSTAANARRMMQRLQQRVESRLEATHRQTTPSRDPNDHNSYATTAAAEGKSRKREIADELGASIARYPDELLDLSPAERAAEVCAAYQDPITREPTPIIWIPQDAAGGSEDVLRRVQQRYGGLLQYSNAGAYLTQKGKCEVTQPAPDVRSDWLLDWVL